MKEIKKCAICGVTSETKRISTVNGVQMCQKHKLQIWRYGKITDKTPRTTQDKNKIILYDDYAELIVKNSNNTKEYKVKIDLDDVLRVSQEKWRYERRKNDHGGYIVTGRTATKRIGLHRFVMNYDGPLQVDHINRNTLDNRKQNLRIVTQVINSQNISTKKNCITKMPNGKYRVKITRFKRTFIFGLFDTEREAEIIKNEFLDFIKENEQTIVKNYYNEHQTPEKETSFYDGDKKLHTKTFKTLKETIENRPDFRELLKTEQAIA